MTECAGCNAIEHSKHTTSDGRIVCATCPARHVKAEPRTLSALDRIAARRKPIARPRVLGET